MRVRVLTTTMRVHVDSERQQLLRVVCLEREMQEDLRQVAECRRIRLMVGDSG